MNIKRILSVASLSAIFLSGCTPALDTNPLPGPNNQALNAPVTPAQAKIDAKILGTLIVINENEIAAAMEAQRRAAHPAVKNYAAWLYREHSQNLQETQRLSQKIGVQPVKGYTAAKLQQQGKHEIAALSRLNNKAFDQAYILAMIKGHAAVLQLINHKLLVEASTPPVKQLLESTRRHVVAHLQQAKVVQREIAH